MKTFLIGFWRRIANSDIVRRAFHTFWQAAGGVLIARLVVAHSSHDIQVAVVVAGAAGLSAVKSMVVNYYGKR